MAPNVDPIVDKSNQISAFSGSGEESKAVTLQDHADEADTTLDVHDAQSNSATRSYPDGGFRAWLVVTGFWFCERVGPYYETQLLKDTSSSDM
ncbi:hypothetical protein C0995_004513 [Termitomyces sp. Mi166|nr:hypothetical protein C0995_004513 [Termitomyces sp. Mi166\